MNKSEIEKIVLTGISKVAIERVSAPVFGVSALEGLMKAIAGYFIVTNTSGLTKSLGYGVAVDGIEDIVISLLAGNGIQMFNRSGVLEV